MPERGSPYKNRRVEGEPERELEPKPEMPVIDIIRHGRTDYKELKDPDFRFDPEADDFELDAEHLDLNEDGIEDMQNAAKQLEELIDKENEALILISSPNFRAQSSALVAEDYMRQQGIEILNERDLKTTDSLRAVGFKDEKMRPVWIAMDKEYRDEDPVRYSQPPDDAHEEIAARLGHDLGDLFQDEYPQINKRFERFLRHMGNIHDWLSEETKERLEGKKLRIVAFTHEELPIRFMKGTLKTQENLKKGQILEIRPEDFLRKEDTALAQVRLYEKPGEDSESGEVVIEREFKN